MKRFSIFIMLFIIFLPPTFAFADNYKISVTRKEQNLYKVDHKQIYIHTKYLSFRKIVIQINRLWHEFCFGICKAFKNGPFALQ